MIFVDSSYLFALLDRRDQLHSTAVAWQSVLESRLTTTDYVLWEVMNAFSAPLNRVKAHAALDEIRSEVQWELVTASPELFERGLTLHRQSTDKDWSLTDCTSFVVMRQRGIFQALTYDHHFEQAGFEALLRRDPP